MKQFLLVLLIASQAFALSACHNRLIHNRADEYAQAKSIPPMEIPPEFSSTDVTAYYPVPSDNDVDLAQVDLLPPNLTRPDDK